MNYFRNDVVSVLIETVRKDVRFFLFIPEVLKSQQMYEFVVKEEALLFMGVPDKFKAQEKCEFGCLCLYQTGSLHLECLRSVKMMNSLKNVLGYPSIVKLIILRSKKSFYQ